MILSMGLRVACGFGFGSNVVHCSRLMRAILGLLLSEGCIIDEYMSGVLRTPYSAYSNYNKFLRYVRFFLCFRFAFKCCVRMAL